ncbi:hypothetical protein PMIN06_012673 [Paraphaeosphaeria minitans]
MHVAGGRARSCPKRPGREVFVSTHSSVASAASPQSRATSPPEPPSLPEQPSPPEQSHQARPSMPREDFSEPPGSAPAEVAYNVFITMPRGLCLLSFAPPTSGSSSTTPTTQHRGLLVAGDCFETEATPPVLSS